MNISPVFSLIFLLSLEKCNGRSGGRGGSRGRSYSRSGGGGKFHSSSSHSYINHDSSGLRSTLFKPSTSNSYFSTGTTGNTYIISQPATPIIYDNHYYYWHGYYHSRPEKKTVCEYTITEEDGELFNVTFSNGTTPKSMTFGCGSFETCCGMTCCSTLGTWIAM
uniref:CX domain-containing protein n=1 Tax=Caenorhabditis tropicalis TaxID=1561998 RepID=A0A1I7UKF2_9PELO